ncbi:hypothetical protein POTOM_046329 [Populus tomentosa]|uniref:Uncharacterized protein n=1 Tax=Populus tomentosa TaxID=118781 RepID=A0A8X8CCG2_POPTO|nr:hypothetical protein POTOM_046329 [Populus tomentosa]
MHSRYRNGERNKPLYIFVAREPSYLSKDRGPLLGQSIFSINGLIWSHKRKIIAPEFYIRLMIFLLEHGEPNGGLYNHNDIISRACFGSNYTKGKEILSKLRTRQDERNAAKYENDLLQMILEGAKSYGDQESFPSDVSLDRFIMDNSKAIYFAGHETTAITASWCLMLLAANQEWQARARAEVLEICKINLPDADMLRNMKTLTMVIQETMRLYPPVVFVIRRAQHNSKRNEHPNSNPSQHFAMAGLILSLILSEFSFSLSPAYHHSPRFGLVVQPGYGVSLHIRRVS